MRLSSDVHVCTAFSGIVLTEAGGAAVLFDVDSIRKSSLDLQVMRLSLDVAAHPTQSTSLRRLGKIDWEAGSTFAFRFVSLLSPLFSSSVYDRSSAFVDSMSQFRQ